MNKENKMYNYLLNHNYISKNKKSNYQSELSVERAECIVNKCESLVNEENEELKQALNKIRKCCESDCIEVSTREYGRLMVCDIYDILQIINEAIGDDDSGNK